MRLLNLAIITLLLTSCTTTNKEPDPLTEQQTYTVQLEENQPPLKLKTTLKELGYTRSTSDSQTFTFNKSNQRKDFKSALEQYTIPSTQLQITYNPETKQITYIPPTPEKTVELITPQVIHTPDEVKLVQKTTPILTQNLSISPEIIAHATTHFSGKSTDNRNKNLLRASELVNGKILRDGETFSLFETTHPYTTQNGYTEAPVIKGEELTTSVGGGVCQVAGTLYNAAIRADLTIIERHNHSSPITYLAPAFDATIANSSIDLKFKNTSGHPIAIFMYLDNDTNTLNCVIIGDKTSAQQDPQRKTDFQGILKSITTDDLHTSTTYELHKYTYINNQLINDTLINTSTYTTPTERRINPNG